MRWQIFHVSPSGFIHSQALSEVAIALRRGLLLLGHQADITYQYKAAYDQTIVLGANFAPAEIFSLTSESIIIYNLEQIALGSPWLSPYYLRVLNKFSVWDYSKQNIQELTRMGIQEVQHCPIAYVKDLERIPKIEKDIDILFYGSINERRKQILGALQNAGLGVMQIFGLYGQERDGYIARAKIILNLHFYESKVFEIVRVSYLLANGCFVVTENSPQPEIESQLASGMILCPYDKIVFSCLEYIRKDQEREAIAIQGHKLFSNWRQEDMLRPLIKKSVLGAM